MLSRRIIGIIGTGQVGMAAAYAIFQQRIASKLILVDLDKKRAEGEAMDLEQGQAYVGRCSVQAGEFKDLKDAQIIVICAGSAQKPGESRLALLNRNAGIFKAIAKELDEHAPEAILLIASNPVDILTYIMHELSHRPPNRILGTGTMLDTTRFRTLLGEYYNVDPRSVHAVIIGEHGDSELPLWSAADIAGTAIPHHTIMDRSYDREELDKIFQRAKNAAYDIIERKGFTNWAIGLVIAHLARTILGDQNSVLPVSIRLQGEYGISDVCLSLPSAVGIDGMVKSLPPALNESELKALKNSANVLKKSLSEIEYK